MKIKTVPAFAVGVEGEEAWLLRLDSPKGFSVWYRYTKDGFKFLEDTEADALEDEFRHETRGSNSG